VEGPVQLLPHGGRADGRHALNQPWVRLFAEGAKDAVPQNGVATEAQVALAAPGNDPRELRPCGQLQRGRLMFEQAPKTIALSETEILRGCEIVFAFGVVDTAVRVVRLRVAPIS
jgi:hypothetical protein